MTKELIDMIDIVCGAVLHTTPVNRRQWKVIEDTYNTLRDFEGRMADALEPAHDWQRHPADGIIPCVKCRKCETVRIKDSLRDDTTHYIIPDGIGHFTIKVGPEEPTCGDALLGATIEKPAKPG